MNKQLNIVELFSGIGSQAAALKNIGYKIRVLNTCEWDTHAFVAYDAIHNSVKNYKKYNDLDKDELVGILSKYTLSSDGKQPMSRRMLESLDSEVLKRICTAIKRTNNLVDVTSIKGSKMPNHIDLLTYSFPCQDLSNVGAFHGYTKGIDPNSGSRSSLLWQVGRILSEMKELNKVMPRYLVMENVPSLLSKRHIGNFEQWQLQLEKIGYLSKAIPLNARDFGIPQNRPRLLMLSIYVGESQEMREKCKSYFGNLTSSKIIDDYRKSEYFVQKNIDDLLREPNESNNYKYLNEVLECTPNDTKSRRKIWENNPKIINENYVLTNEKFIRTVTTKQDRHPNSGNIYFDSKIYGKSKFHYLTPRECMLFMGFTDDDFEKIVNNNPCQSINRKFFPRDKIIRMAGNSIPVKLLEGFFFQLKKLDSIFGD